MRELDERNEVEWYFLRTCWQILETMESHVDALRKLIPTAKRGLAKST